MRRIGIHLETISLDDSAGLFALDRTWSDEDNKKLQATIDMVYDRFLDLVSQSRGIELDKLKQLAGGRVWSGSQAKQNGLVDEIGGVDDCLKVIAKKAKLEDYRVVHRPIPRSGLDLSDLLGASGEEEIWSGISKAVIPMLHRHGISLQSTKLLISDGLRNSGKPTVWLLNPNEIRIGWN
jgi:protease-4